VYAARVLNLFRLIDFAAMEHCLECEDCNAIRVIVQGYVYNKSAAKFVVEAAGVEPASENVTGQEPTCVVQFMPWALPQDVRGVRSERTRNTSR
jgi:arginyl-tRNA--protein-N-Asp/Glu arginylyltransferase